MSSGEKVTCPLCNDAVDKLLYRFHINNERKAIERIKEKNPERTESDVFAAVVWIIIMLRLCVSKYRYSNPDGWCH